jgi:hypothetical protein
VSATASSFHANGGASITAYSNGASLGQNTVALYPPATSPVQTWFFGMDSVAGDTYGMCPVTIHEFGILDGYAATAHDVANNAMFAIPYGFRGSFLPVTDAPVA